MSRRKWCCWIYTILSLYGLAVALLFAQMEVITRTNFYNNSKDLTHWYPAVQPIKATITITTIILIFTTCFYHYNEIQIFKFDNSLSPKSTLIGNSYKLLILFEILIISIHPIWLGRVTHYGDENEGSVDISFIDFHYLYFLMLTRLGYIFRIFIVTSRVFYSTKVETVASLNKISTGQLNYENIRLIIRSCMERDAGKVMLYVIMFNWFFVAWLIHLTESRNDIVYPPSIHNGEKAGVCNFIDAMWLVPITFTTIGYGDYTPKSFFGRVFCMWLGLLGALCTAILVGLMTDKLAMVGVL